MKAFKDFIVEIPNKFSETFKTENGVELHGSGIFSKKRMANTIVTVKEVPFENKTEITVGDQLFLDPSLFMEQTYSIGGEQENIYLLDKEKGLFRVETSLIIAFKKGGGDWTMLNNNVLLERIKESDPEKPESFLYMPKIDKDKKGVAKLFIDVPELDIKKGDVIYIDEMYINDIWFGDTPLVWLRQKYLLGKQLKQAV